MSGFIKGEDRHQATLFPERLAPDFKTIADFRKDNGAAIRLVCREFVVLCRKLNLFANAFVAIDGSKFKAVNNRDRNYKCRSLNWGFLLRHKWGVLLRH